MTTTTSLNSESGRRVIGVHSDDKPSRGRRFVAGLADLIDEEVGTTAVEYAVMVAMIAVFIIASVNLMTEAAEENFTATADAIAGV